jgi:hypothetical protein
MRRTRSPHREALESELHAQLLDVLDGVVGAEERAAVTQQSCAGRRLAARVARGGGLEVAATEGACPGSALVEHDQVAAGRLPRVLIDRAPGVAGPPRQHQHEPAVDPVVAVVALHAQGQAAGHDTAVVERDRQLRALAFFAVAEAQLRLGARRDPQPDPQGRDQ